MSGERVAVLAACCFVLGGCGNILGFSSFSTESDSGAGTKTLDSSTPGTTKDAAQGSETGVIVSGDGSEPEDGGVDDANPVEEDAMPPAPEAAPPPPLPPPGKPGLDLTAGGNFSSTANYSLIGAVGESPGGNLVSSSTQYTLQGGVIAGTQ
jgi:hypothetical protein